MAEDNTVYYPVTAREIGEAHYLDCEKTKVAIVPYPERPGSYQVAPTYPPLVEWIKNGGVIEESGFDCLGYTQRNKIYEVQQYAQQVLEEKEPDYRRQARIARMRTVALQTQRDYAKATFDKNVLGYAANICGQISVMCDINTINSIDVPNLDWPSK